MDDSLSSVAFYLMSELAALDVIYNISGDALFGAFLGAWLIAASKKKPGFFDSVAHFFLSIGVGYLFAPMAQQLVPFLTEGSAAFCCALVVIPMSKKLMAWLKGTDLWEIIRRFLGRR